MEGDSEVHSDTALLHLLCLLRQLEAAQEVVAALRAVGGGAVSEATQRLLLRRGIASPLATALPCGADYQRRLLKAMVLAAEEDGVEVLDELMELYAACLVAPGDSITPGPASLGGLPALPAPPAGWCYKLFTYTPSGQAPGATLNCLAQLEAAWEAAGETGASASEGDQQAVGGPAATSSSAEGGPPGELPARLPPLAQAGGCCGAVTLRVSRNLFEGGTGCHEWEAGFFLSEIVLSNPSVVKGRSCLELGSGCGMVGVALHRAGAASVLCTDGDADSVLNCRFNLQINSVPLAGMGVRQQACGRLCFSGPAAAAAAAAAAAQSGFSGGAMGLADCRELRWEEGAGQLAPQVVLGADILYDPLVIPTLLELVKQLLRGGAAAAAAQEAVQHAEQPEQRQQEGAGHPQQHPAVALIATTRRNEATLAQFVAAVEADSELVLEDVTQAAAEGRLAAGPGGGERAVRFLHHAALDAARDRIVLHRLTLA